LFESPEAGARTIARLPPAVAATVLGTTQEFVKLQLGGGRFAFARVRDLDEGGAPAAAVAFEDTMTHAPPAIELGASVLATKDAHAVIKGAASDSERLLDTYIFVGARKVFYRSNRNATDTKKMAFEADLPLRPGVNIVSVVSRENPDTSSRKTFVIRRDGPNGELLATPKTDDELSETAGASDD
jgi:carboxyl-terminal processing protease